MRRIRSAAITIFGCLGWTACPSASSSEPSSFAVSAEVDSVVSCQYIGEGVSITGGITGAIIERPSLNRDACGADESPGVSFSSAGTLLLSWNNNHPHYMFCPGRRDKFTPSRAEAIDLRTHLASVSEYRVWFAPVRIERPGQPSEIFTYRLWAARVGVVRFVTWTCNDRSTEWLPYDEIDDDKELCPGLFLVHKSLDSPSLEYRAPDGSRVCVPAVELDPIKYVNPTAKDPS